MNPNGVPELLRPTKRASSEHITLIERSPLSQRPSSVVGKTRQRALSGIQETSEYSASHDQPKLYSHEASRETKPTAIPNRGLVTPDAYDGPSTVPPLRSHRGSSSLSLPLTSLPERVSSRKVQRRQSDIFIGSGNFVPFPSLGPPPPRGVGSTIGVRRPSSSPVKHAAQRDAVSSDSMRRIPSRTFVRSVKPTDILEITNASHPRVEMRLRIGAPMFVGGGTIEGQVQLKVDDSSSAILKKTFRITIARISVDVVGVEQVSDGRQWIFTSLATELIDARHPPPLSLVTSPEVLAPTELYWVMKKGSADIPFRLNLPLEMGPPPYRSKHAQIRYILCSTALIKINDRQHIVRRSMDIAVLTVFDPERALSSLPSPLIVSEEMQLPGTVQSNTVRLTAGLHRQTWVDGSNIFVDVHIMNNSSKTIKRLEIQIEKTTLFYDHAAAGTVEKSIQHLRLPQRKETGTIARLFLKKDKVWNGVQPRASEIGTWEIEVPRGHVTISTGRYFEVRYFLNVLVDVSLFRVIQVQLPITLIHMNSLDIVPNSLAQVAAAIDDKRSRSIVERNSFDAQPVFTQGSAFSAPRRQSIADDAGELNSSQIEDLKQELNDSPRKVPGNVKTTNMVSHRRSTLGFQGKGKNRSDGPHCHRRHASSISSIPRLPRVQVSTSGLGFSETDFDVSPVRPPQVYNYEELRSNWLRQRQRKALSEREWKELRMQQELHRARKRNRSFQAPPGWRNVAVERARTEWYGSSRTRRGKPVWVEV